MSRMKYRVSSKFKDMDSELICDFIANSYWAKGRPRSVMKRAMHNSLCFGLFLDDTADPQQIGFGRMVTDRAVFAYLADVFVLPEHRGKGAATFLMNTIMQHPDVQNLRRIMLVTRDAHDLYRGFGFEAPQQPSRLMEIADTSDYSI